MHKQTHTPTESYMNLYDLRCIELQFASRHKFTLKIAKFLLYAWRHSANSMFFVVCVRLFVFFHSSSSWQRAKSIKAGVNWNLWIFVIHAYHSRKLFQLVRTLFDSTKIKVKKKIGTTVWHVSRRYEIVLLIFFCSHLPYTNSIHYHIGQMMNLISKNNLHDEIRFHRRRVPPFTHFN